MKIARVMAVGAMLAVSGSIVAEQRAAAEAPSPVLVRHLEVGGVASGALMRASSDASSATLAFGTGMSRGFYDAIKNAFVRRSVLPTFAVIEMDAARKLQGRTDFHNALITEIAFPAGDGAGKDAAFMTVKWAPERVRYKKGDGSEVKAEFTPHQKTWLPSNFKLKIDGLDGALAHVAKVDAITVKMITSGPIYRLDCSPVAVTVPAADARLLEEWHKASVQAGPNGSPVKKNGSLTYLTPTGEEIITLTFFGLGIFKMTPDKAEAGNENVRRVKYEMHCEQIRFSYGGGATWAMNDVPSDPFLRPAAESSRPAFALAR